MALNQITPYSGIFPDRSSQDRDVFANNIFDYITWSGSTFVAEINTLSTDLTTWTDDLNTLEASVREDSDFVAGAKATIEATMGATYVGAWNDTDDFTNKTTTHNGLVWVGLSPTVGVEPDFNEDWLFISYATKKVYKSVDYLALAGDEVYVDTSASKVTITLPPIHENLRVRIIDREWTFNTNNCDVVASDGSIINKIEDGTPYQIDIRGASRTLEAVRNKNNVLEWRTV